MLIQNFVKLITTLLKVLLAKMKANVNKFIAINYVKTSQEYKQNKIIGEYEAYGNVKIHMPNNLW